MPEDAPIYEGEKEPPEGIAEGIVAAIEGGTFEHYIPDMKPFVDALGLRIDTEHERFHRPVLLTQATAPAMKPSMSACFMSTTGFMSGR